MLELYIFVGLMLSIGSLLVCKKKSIVLYCMIFVVITFFWPAVAFAAYMKP